MCHAIAYATGANLFDLSPRNTDGKYPGKTVAMMVHMVCSLSALLWTAGFSAGWGSDIKLTFLIKPDSA